jgi:hypothetical protein
MNFKIKIKYNKETLLYSDIGGWHLKKKNYVVPLILFESNNSKAYREKGGSKFFYKKKMDKQDIIEINKSFTVGKKELPYK